MNTQRFVEIDALRTIAIILMVIYHFAFDLQYYYDLNINVNDGYWWLIGRSAAVLFLLLVGASFIVSSRYKTFPNVLKRSTQRAAWLLCIATLISVVTYVAEPETYIRFGILHCIGVSLLLLPFFMKLKEWNACIGIILMLVGTQMSAIQSSTSLLLPFGVRHPGFVTLDYYPLLPWFGVVLLGMGIGYIIYIDCRRQPAHIGKVCRTLLWPGKHSLAIYLLHQPILLSILHLIP